MDIQEKLYSLSKTYFGLYYDDNLGSWMSYEDYSVDYLQMDLYTCAHSFIQKIILTEIYYNYKDNNPWLIAELEQNIEKALVVNIRKIIKKEKNRNNDIGTKTVGDFVNDIQAIIGSTQSNPKDRKIKALTSAIGSFTAKNYNKKMKSVEGQFLHKDSMPQKRIFKKESYQVVNNLPTKVKGYSQHGVLNTEISEMLEKASMVINSYTDMADMPLEAIFYIQMNINELVNDYLKLFNAKDASLSKTISRYISRIIPKTLSLLQWESYEANE